MSHLKLEPAGDDYLLSTANGMSITLSDADILTLAQSAPLLRDHVLSKHSRGGVNARSSTPVAQAVLNTDLHRTEILLEMIDQYGTRVGFVLPLDVARPLSERLPHRVAEIEQAVANRKTQ
jgi:hypothetical protein